MPFPVELKWVHHTEAKLGVKFPAAFVTAMVAMNGGSVETSMDQFELYPFFDGSDRKRIQRTCSSIDRETGNARLNLFEFPDNAVVIGHDGGGNLLILLTMKDSPGRLQHTIYSWDHETSEIDQVANDFDDLKKS